MKSIILLIFFLSVVSAPYCRAEKLVVYQDGSSVIYGNLPNSWTAMSEQELSDLMGNDQQAILEKILILPGYRLVTPENSSAMLFVFYVNRQERISWEKRQNFFSWFKGNKDFMSSLLPDAIDEFSLDDIEYLQNKDTMLFKTKMKVGDTEIRGVNGIIFLRKGYLNIVGYVANGSSQQFNDFYSFIKTLNVSSSLKYSKSPVSFIDDYNWLQDNWQKILGGAIFLFVYGITFLHRDKNRLVAKGT